jgi:hypothetical protein
MKTLIIALCLLVCPAFVNAEYYCTLNKDDSYTCKKVDFEIREFRPDSKDAFIIITKELQTKYKCFPKGNEWNCTPFDKGAIILDIPKECPSDSSWTNQSVFLTN